MAIAQIQETVALSGIAFGAVFLLLNRRRAGIRLIFDSIQSQSIVV